MTIKFELKTDAKYKGCINGTDGELFCSCTKTSYFTLKLMVHFRKFVLKQHTL